MANLYGYDLMYAVYQIVQNDGATTPGTLYSLVFIRSFYDEGDAREWIIQEGKRQVDYTVLPVYRNK